ncbi:MAG: serine protease [Myxococcaceae bacterium]|nr:MAG: serine protease [Myxococcaceae bacterium]
MARSLPLIVLCAALSLGATPALAQVDPSPEPRVVATPPNARARLPRVTVNVLDGRDSLARGVVLQDTGRILTALVPVREARDLRVVYPDGRIDRARVVATDPAWGVALLEGNAGRWVEGLRISDRDGRARDEVSWVPIAGSRVSSGLLRRRRSFVGGNAALLRDAWELDPIPANSAVGSGVFHHATATLVGLIVPPDRESEITGADVAFAVPATVLRALANSAAAAARPWLGLVMVEIPPGASVRFATGGLRIASVAANGPGAAAGLRGGPNGDVIVAADNRAVRSLADLGDILEGRQIGQEVTLRVTRGGATFDETLTLAARPAPREEPNEQATPRGPGE